MFAPSRIVCARFDPPHLSSPRRYECLLTYGRVGRLCGLLADCHLGAGMPTPPPAPSEFSLRAFRPFPSVFTLPCSRPAAAAAAASPLQAGDLLLLEPGRSGERSKHVPHARGPLPAATGYRPGPWRNCGNPDSRAIPPSVF